MDEFTQGGFRKMLGKPYLVYDIETSLIPDDQNLKNVEYYIGYSMEEDNEGKMHYQCIMKADLPAFVDKMLQFDGYIVGFNQLYFDNPVCIYNINGTEEQIKTLNDKSLDLYLFVQQMTGKRMGLNKISEALIGVSKNLEGGGASVESLWNEWKATQDDKVLKKIQAYCKNDVRMTALLFFYFLHFKKLYIEGEEYLYDIATFLQYAQVMEKKMDTASLRNQALL
ncbi:MAG: ribonuclease H-like domain-containing protein [Candidatus Peribacteria bacterium]|jgi:uncharacterized protein YprB with RNaseH-like and TPR domain|nr:ribonuclease H-like domain-containing protein [Candidatus Peribacteria bacterium]